MPAGSVAWQVWAKRTDEGTVLGSGRSTVCPSLDAAGPGFDPRTPAERWLDALIAVGPAILAGGYQTLEMAGRRAELRSLDEYQRALNAARAAVNEERAAGTACMGGTTKTGNRKRILAHFTSP